MRQLAEGGRISPRPQTCDAGTQFLSNVRAPGTGEIVPVCLPLVSEANTFLWVYSNQLELPANSVAELVKAFDEFPYLTKEQSVELAKRSSLHQDQVKVWFIAKRIEFGISWDFEDICYVRYKYRSKKKDDENREGQNEMDEKMQESKRKENNPKNKEEESGEETRGGGKNPKGGTTMAQEVSTNENLERKTKTKQTAKKVKLTNAEENTNTRKKQKIGSKIDKERKESVKQSNANQTDPHHSGDAPSTPGNVSFKGKPEALAGLQEDLHTEASVSDVFVTDVGKLKELTTVNVLTPAADTPAPIKKDAEKDVARASGRNKTKAQLAMLKGTFLHCQYPDSEQYTWLSELTRIPRSNVVQWYGDMRYALKRAKPRWMSNEQFKQTLVNIQYHQYRNKLKRSTGGLDHMNLVEMLHLCKASEEEKDEASEVKF